MNPKKIADQIAQRVVEECAALRRMGAFHLGPAPAPTTPAGLVGPFKSWSPSRDSLGIALGTLDSPVGRVDQSKPLISPVPREQLVFYTRGPVMDLMPDRPRDEQNNWTISQGCVFGFCRNDMRLDPTLGTQTYAGFIPLTWMERGPKVFDRTMEIGLYQLTLDRIIFVQPVDFYDIPTHVDLDTMRRLRLHAAG